MLTKIKDGYWIDLEAIRAFVKLEKNDFGKVLLAIGDESVSIQLDVEICELIEKELNLIYPRHEFLANR